MLYTWLYFAGGLRHQPVHLVGNDGNGKKSGWFVVGLLSQTLIVHMIRTRRVPFIQSCASWPLMIMTVIVMIVGIALPFSPLASYLQLQALPLSYFPWLVAILAGYMTLTQLVKGFYSRRYGWQ
ncbi:cation transporting ATPase C-terminal domain-containing protein [Escherichia sp. HC-CC4]